MYSRNSDPRRQMSLPRYYSGNAFRPDGTQSPVPVIRDIAPNEEKKEKKGDIKQEAPLQEREVGEKADISSIEQGQEGKQTEQVFSDLGAGTEEETPRFLSKLLRGVIPDIASDDSLLLCLLFLLYQSRSEEGENDELLLLLLLLLFLG